MHNTCGESVNFMPTTSRKNSVCLSTASLRSAISAILGSAQRVVFPMLFQNRAHSYTHRIIAILPLIEHYFYPQSTVPIIINSKGKKV